MTYKNFLSVLCLACISAGSLPAQTRTSGPVSQLPKVEPFKIERGSSFDASPSGRPAASFAAEPAAPPRSRIGSDMEEALNVIRRNHVDGNRLDAPSLAKSSIDEMLRALDPHSSFFDESEYRDLLDEQHSEYSGVGCTIANYGKDGRIETYIVSTHPGSPAQAAGLRFGDRIEAVDGRAVSGEESDVVRDLIRGRYGSTTKLVVERAATGKFETVQLRRVRLSQPTVSDSYMIKPGVGYIGLLNGFSYTTSTEVDAAIRSLRRGGMTSLVLDLRGNTGGILEQAVKVAEKFLPAGSLIVSQRGRSAIDNRVWKSSNRFAEKMPLVVLVDGDSASASEVVAGALQDHDRALIVGERTFGKGLVQSVLNLPQGAGLTLTTARYFTPSGRSIQRVYEGGDLYDYYNRKPDSPEPVGKEAETAAHRKVYGGNGIAPDEVVAGKRPTHGQIQLLDAIFFFSAQAANGRIKVTPTVPVSNQSDAQSRHPEVLAFAEFLGKHNPWNIAAETIAAERSFIEARIRYNLALAAKGTLAADQLAAREDPQLSKAVESLPKAAELATLARKTLRASITR